MKRCIATLLLLLAYSGFIFGFGAKQEDYYNVLGLDSRNSNSIDTKEIKRAYRKKAVRYMPDSRVQGAADRFKLITEAYEVLSDPEKRAEYDRGEYKHKENGDNLFAGLGNLFNFKFTESQKEEHKSEL
jgi:DnaJ-class molecular chaperone